MKTIEISQQDFDPFLKKITNVQEDIENINKELISLGFPPIKVKIGELQDVKEYIAISKNETIEEPTLFYDLKNNISVK